VGRDRPLEAIVFRAGDQANLSQRRKLLFGFGVIILLMVIKPTGLIGEVSSERV